MKLTSLIGTAAVAGLIVVTTVTGSFAAFPARPGATRSIVTPVIPLSSSEISMLTYMREEEKLARDVYISMYQKWSAVTFANIANSEQKHTDTLKKFLDKYNLPDPFQEAVGVFTNVDLQGKYDQLLAIGSQSYIDGLYVGATIEEIDMLDIQHAIDVTTHIDVLTAYRNLLEGSKNHLNAYVKALSAQGVIYTPQFISQEFYDAILGL
jgi:hypothetical protein